MQGDDNVPVFDKQARAERKERLEKQRAKEVADSQHPKLTKLKQDTLDRMVNYTSVFPKWFAGTTDVAVANATKADTILLLSKQVAHKEALSGTLPDGYTEKQRRNQDEA